MKPEQLATQLASDEAFVKLSEDEQNAIFRDLVARQQQAPATQTDALAEPQGRFRAALTNVFDRPAAATRGAVQAAAPGGETPQQAYMRGATHPSTVPTFQDLLINRAQNQAVQRGRPGPLQRSAQAVMSPPATIASVIDRTMRRTPADQLAPAEIAQASLPASAMGMAADFVTNPADLILALLPSAPGINKLGSTKAWRAVERALTKERYLTKASNRILTADDVLRVPEAKLPELTKPQQSLYFRKRGEMVKAHFEAQSQALKELETSLGKQLQQASVDRVNELRPMMLDAMKRRSELWRNTVNAEIAPITNHQINEQNVVKFLTQKFGDDPALLNEVTAQLGLTIESAGTGRVGDLWKQAMDLGESLPRSIRAKAVPYGRSDYIKDRGINALVDYLDQEFQMTLQASRAGWAQWAPIRDQMVREFLPGLQTGTKTARGGRMLVRTARGVDPHNAQFASQLADELGLPDLHGSEIQQLVNSMSTVQKERIALATQSEQAQTALRDLRSRITQITDKTIRKTAGIKSAFDILWKVALSYGAYRVLNRTSEVVGGSSFD